MDTNRAPQNKNELLSRVCAFDPGGTALREASPVGQQFQKLITQYRVEHEYFPTRQEDPRRDELNALFISSWAATPLGELCNYERDVYNHLFKEISLLSEAELSRPGMLKGQSLREVIPDQTYRHYRMHIPTIRE